MLAIIIGGLEGTSVVQDAVHIQEDDSDGLRPGVAHYPKLREQ